MVAAVGRRDATADAVDLRGAGRNALVVPGRRGIAHVLLRSGAHECRLDIAGDAPRIGPLALEYRLRDGAGVPRKIATILRLRSLLSGRPEPIAYAGERRRLRRIVEAIRFVDAFAAGASLRAVAAVLHPTGDAGDPWPGRGDHIKSWVRRRIAAARDLVRRGPAVVLADEGFAWPR